MRFVVIGIFLVGVLAFFSYLTGGGESNPQSSYVPNSGDCMVLPQGQDPVYDQFYAKEVNTYNCKSFVNQGEGKVLNAEAERIESETKRGNIAMGAFGLLALLIAGFFVYAIIKGGGSG